MLILIIILQGMCLKKTPNQPKALLSSLSQVFLSPCLRFPELAEPVKWLQCFERSVLSFLVLIFIRPLLIKQTETISFSCWIISLPVQQTQPNQGSDVPEPVQRNSRGKVVEESKTASFGGQWAIRLVQLHCKKPHHEAFVFPGKHVSGQTFCIKNSACPSNNTHVALTAMVAGKINLWLKDELVFIKIVVSV